MTERHIKFKSGTVRVRVGDGVCQHQWSRLKAKPSIFPRSFCNKRLYVLQGVC